uniref:Uncharacterized protein n=1 Tax=Mycena chlorophos TaxID=658473 RepID=A0ABQ0L220_MYCCL|nr:predicted protein [Mycena chlorophos]
MDWLSSPCRSKASPLKRCTIRPTQWLRHTTRVFGCRKSNWTNTSGSPGRPDDVCPRLPHKLSEVLAQTLEVKTVDAPAGKERAAALHRENAMLAGGRVENRVLTKAGPVKRHLELELPEGMSARHFRKARFVTFDACWHVLASVTRKRLSSAPFAPISLTVGTPVKLSKVLTGYSWLSQSATKHVLDVLGAVAE